MPQRPAATGIPAAPAIQQAHLFEGVQVDSDSDSGQLGPAVLISPVKAWAAKWGNKSDVDVWSLPDDDIIGE
jgi:hypothetical protein